MSQYQPLLEMQHISKSFPGVQALKQVSLSILPGEIMALVGENGAGKSTLMKILNGVYTADSGTIIWQGQPVTIRNPHEAQALGISMIHQELALVPYLDAAKNIYLGREPRGLVGGTVNWGTMYRDAQAQIDRLNLNINIRTPVRYLSIAQQQMVEVAKALSMNARLIVMDEPTSSLTDREVETLFEQMRVLRAEGVAIIYISHRLNEIFEICDRITVLRDGEYVGTERVQDLTHQDIIRMMVGRELSQIYEKPPKTVSPNVVLQVRDLNRGKRVKDISFDLRRGEILGFAGLVGSGRTELMETIFGARAASSGTIAIDGETINPRHPTTAIRHGIGLVPEDRKREGLFLRMSVSANMVMAALRRLVLGPFIKHYAVRQVSQQYIDDLGVRTPSARQRVQNLSGGNQQKVVIAKWLTLNPKVLILDEPTRGIDVGAKSEIYKLMHQLSNQGVGIIMISSELPEIMGVSDRILVMHEGRITGEFNPDQVTQEDIMQAATGLNKRG